MLPWTKVGLLRPPLPVIEPNGVGSNLVLLLPSFRMMIGAVDETSRAPYDVRRRTRLRSAVHSDDDPLVPRRRPPSAREWPPTLPRPCFRSEPFLDRGSAERQKEKKTLWGKTWRRALAVAGGANPGRNSLERKKLRVYTELNETDHVHDCGWAFECGKGSTHAFRGLRNFVPPLTACERFPGLDNGPVAIAPADIAGSPAAHATWDEKHQKCAFPVT